MPPRVTTRIRRAETETDWKRCTPVLLELRSNLTATECLRRVRLQTENGYHLVALERDNQVLAAAGYRVLHSLKWGKYLYVDDLVTLPDHRNQGLGDRLLKWLTREARKLHCEQIHLDSGVQRHAAHGFYLKNRLHIIAYHFAQTLS
ncbi:MAG: GNAT family N-acetyltransferase [Limisphaerales bacterium]